MKILMTAGAHRSNAYQEIRKLLTQDFAGFLLEIEIELLFPCLKVLTFGKVIFEIGRNFKAAYVDAGTNEGAEWFD